MAKVYVSSTFLDLQECRAAVRQALQELGQDDVAMETYVAEPQRPLDKCLADVAACDLYVGVFAWRYGYVPPGYEQSITELEYRTAVEDGKDRLIFLLREDAPWPPSQVDKGRSAELVEELRAELSREQLCSFFSTPDELGRLVTAAVFKQLAKQFKSGPAYLYEGATVARLAYRREIAPLLEFYTQVFAGREGELDTLVALATTEAPGYGLVEAPAGYGKSALLAQLVHRHEIGQWSETTAQSLVYFFVREEGSRDTPEAFCLAVNSQLLDLLKLPGGVPAELEAQRSQLLGLWAAASATASAERPLVMLVDGLDEMAPGAVTICDLLPPELGPYVHVLVSSRPHPEPTAQVAPEHPLRRAHIIRLQSLDDDNIAELLVQQGSTEELAQARASRVMAVTRGEPLLARFITGDVARGGEDVLEGLERDPPAGVKDYFARQLRQLDARAAGDTAWEILGFLLVARGAMSMEELAALLEAPKRHVSRAIAPIRRFLVGQERLELMHLELRTAVTEQFSPAERQAYRRRLLTWCGRASTTDQPEEIPGYVLSHYAGHLQESGDHETLYGLIGRAWMDAKAARTYSHWSFAQDVLLMIQTASAEDPPNLLQKLRGLLIHATLTSRATNVPPKVLGVLAASGQLARAEGFAALISNSARRSEAYLAIAEALRTNRRTQDADRIIRQALTAAQSETQGWWRAQALTGVAGALAQARQGEQAQAAAKQALGLAQAVLKDWHRAQVVTGVVGMLVQVGRVEQALAEAQAVPEGEARAQALAGVAQALVGVGEVERALEVADQALAATQAEPEGWMRAQALAGVARALVGVGEVERALEVAEQALAVAQAEPEDFERANALADVVGALRQAGQVEQALAEALAISTPFQRTHALSDMVRRLAQAGQLDQALEVADQALAATQVAHDVWAQAQLLAEVAWALVGVGEVERALEVADQALAAAQAEPEDWERAQALAEVAGMLVGAGQVERALEVTEQALAAAQTEPEESERVQARTLAGMAKALVGAGQGEPAVVLTEQALVEAEAIPEGGAQAHALAGVAGTLVGVGQVERALEVTEQALAVAQTEPEESDLIQAQVLVEVAGALVGAGEVERALEIGEKALAALHKASEWERGLALADVVGTLVTAGQLERAAAVITTSLSAAMVDDRYLFFRILRKAVPLFAMGEGGKDLRALTEMLIETDEWCAAT